MAYKLSDALNSFNALVNPNALYEKTQQDLNHEQALKNNLMYGYMGRTNTQSDAPAQIVNTDTGSSNLVKTAKNYLGTPYVWGGATPKGFDCSGLVQYVYRQNGKDIPRTSQEQFKSGIVVGSDDLKEGDLVFFKGSSGTSTEPGHVGMYIGNGQYIQAPKSNDVVKISNLSDRKDYVGARRY